MKSAASFARVEGKRCAKRRTAGLLAACGECATPVVLATCDARLTRLDDEVRWCAMPSNSANFTHRGSAARRFSCNRAHLGGADDSRYEHRQATKKNHAKTQRVQ